MRGIGLPDEFGIDQHMRSWAEKEVPTVNIERSHGRFCDYWRANGKTMVDWTACWRNWMRNCVTWGRDLYTPEELRIERLMKEYGSKGFRRAFRHENSVMYENAFIAWELVQRRPRHDTASEISTLVTKLRAVK